MSSLENSTDSSPEQLALEAKIKELQQELQVKQRRFKMAELQSPLFHDTSGVFSVMRSLSEKIEALEREIKALQLKLDGLNTGSDPGEV